MKETVIVFGNANTQDLKSGERGTFFLFERDAVGCTVVVFYCVQLDRQRCPWIKRSTLFTWQELLLEQYERIFEKRTRADAHKIASA